jgi:hypothetical protein
MCPVEWVEGMPSSTGSKFPFYSVKRQTWLVALGDLAVCKVHWVDEFHRTLPHLTGEPCPHCKRGLPPRTAGYLGAARYAGKDLPPEQVIWHIPGECLPLLGEGPHRGLEFEVLRNPPRSPMALTITRTKREWFEPVQPPIDVRHHLIRFWQLDTQKPVAPPPAESDAGILTFPVRPNLSETPRKTGGM